MARDIPDKYQHQEIPDKQINIDVDIPDKQVYLNIEIYQINRYISTLRDMRFLSTSRNTR
jgi:hypothetical protein